MKFKILVYSTLITTCLIPKQKDHYQKINHLIIDAGSSGTRFCFYSINKNQQCNLKSNPEPCYSIDAEDGLANLNQEQIETVLNKGFNLLKTKQFEEIHYISLLGTGGFRKLNQEQQYDKLQAIDTFFKKHIDTLYKIKILSGEEEAYFAWKSIETIYHSKNHITLETGGATVQIALFEKNFEYISLPIGMNDSYNKLIALKEFEKCSYGKQLTYKTYQECKNLIKDYVYNDAMLKHFIEIHKNTFLERPIYALGKAWTSIFNQLKKNSITIEELQSYGLHICQLSEEELIKKIPSNVAKKQCYLFFYHQAQLESIKVNKILKGAESWTVGASVYPELVPACH